MVVVVVLVVMVWVGAAQVRLLVCGTQTCKDAAAGALLELAFDDTSRLMICEGGGIAPLINVLETGSANGREAAAGALVNLSINNMCATLSLKTFKK
jgi:hypothetical protein